MSDTRTKQFFVGGEEALFQSVKKAIAFKLFGLILTKSKIIKVSTQLPWAKASECLSRLENNACFLLLFLLLFLMKIALLFSLPRGPKHTSLFFLACTSIPIVPSTVQLGHYLLASNMSLLLTSRTLYACTAEGNYLVCIS